MKTNNPRYEELVRLFDSGVHIQIYNGDLGYQDLEPDEGIFEPWTDRYRALEKDGSIIRFESKQY